MVGLSAVERPWTHRLDLETPLAAPASIDLSNLLRDTQLYAQRLQEAAAEAAQQMAEFVYTRTLIRAQNDPEWSALADDIETWSQDGQLYIGLNDSNLASQAFQIEFGDEHRPPSPLFRTMGQDFIEGKELAHQHMKSKLGSQISAGSVG
jgi:hypothetical protein